MNRSDTSISVSGLNRVGTSSDAEPIQQEAPPRDSGRGRLRLDELSEYYSPASASASSSAVAWSSSWRSASDRT